MNTNLLFIGGIPGTGKTTTAYRLALEFGIDKVISMDVLKALWSSYIPQNKEPYLYTTTHEAYRLENLSPVDGFLKHCKLMQSLFLELLPSFTDEKCVIIEGAQITSDILKDICSSHFNTVYLNLYCKDKDFLISRYYRKERMRHYGWIENIDTILQLQEYLLLDESANHINICENDHLETVTNLLKSKEEFCI